MNVGGMLSTIHVLILAICSLMLGCQSAKVPHFNFPDDFQVVKSIEAELFSSETNGVRETKTENVDAYSIPDYFDYKRAVEAYEEGRLKASQVSMPHVSTALMVFEETNLVAQAYRDGYEEGLLRNPDMLLVRNRIRMQRQREFWGLYRDEETLCDDFVRETALIQTNCYVHLLSSYSMGYRNGWRVVTKLKRSPIATYLYLLRPNLSSVMLKRAYVYGWYSACYDFFKANPDLYYASDVLTGMDPRNFYSVWISAFKRLEGEFMLWNCKKKECVKWPLSE